MELGRLTDGLLLGIDIGTSSCKAVLVDRRGRQVAAATFAYPTTFGRDGSVTQEASAWVSAASKAVLAALAGQPRHAVAAIGVAGVAHNAVLIDRHGRPLAPVIRYDDGRPSRVIPALEAELGDGIVARTFAHPRWSWTLTQLVWLRANHPQLWSSLDAMLIQKDFLRHQLTGRAATDPSDATGTGMVDQSTGSWDPSLLAVAGLDPHHVPPIEPSISVAGLLTATWARTLGLRSGTPVAMGATDTCAELVSLGALEPGASSVKAASTGTVVAVSDQPRPDLRYFTYPHAVPGRWYSLAATSTGSTALAWLAQRARPDGTGRRRGSMDPAGDAIAAAARIAPGSDGLLFLPFLEGERAPYWDRDFRAALIGLSTAHTNAHLYRAAIEGVAFSLRSCRDLMESAGFRIERPFLGGGVMATRLWRRVVSSALGIPTRIAEPQGPAVGAALIAAAAIGAEPSRDGRLVARPRIRTERPDPVWTAIYDERYGWYTEAVAAVAETSRRLARSSF